MDIGTLSLEMHRRNKGKLAVKSKVSVNTRQDLSMAYTPGVAEPCREIEKNPEKAYEYTSKGNMVAVVTDGSAVLGLGNIGPLASIPVMEGKAVLFKEFADVDAFPICLDTQDTDEIVRTVKLLSPYFGGINLEDISAPRCFEIERRLKEELDIPVFHDDQHGTAIVVLAGLLNAMRLTGRKLGEQKIVINGAGAAGIAIAKLLLSSGAGEIIMCDRHGAIHMESDALTAPQLEMAKVTNPHGRKGSLSEIVTGSDIFIGVSAPNVLTGETVRKMNPSPIIFAMANPTPEIMPDEAKAAGAYIVGTGRSDFPNQVNNVLAFPGIFKGALSARAKDITEEMKVAAAHAIADSVDISDLSPDFILPKATNKNVASAVAKAVKKAVIF